MRLAAILAVLLVATGCVSASVSETVTELKADAELGSGAAATELGTMFLTGTVVRRNCNLGRRYLQNAADSGHLPAEIALGQMFQRGCAGRMRSPTKSLNWFRSAADQGSAEGQYLVGAACLNGDVMPQDDVEASKWFRLAADQGHIEAIFSLGLLYERGMGLLQNNIEAEKWYLQAAKQGHAGAQSRLGTLYSKGPKLIRRPIEAYAWLSVATANGNKVSADLRDEVARKLEADEFTKAQKLAAEYFEKYKAK